MKVQEELRKGLQNASEDMRKNVYDENHLELILNQLGYLKVGSARSWKEKWIHLRIICHFITNIVSGEFSDVK